VGFLRFDEKVAIITGGGGGLGREYALLLASRGAHVVVNDIGGSVKGEGTDEGPARRVVQEILDKGGIAVEDTHSVATEDGGRAIVETALDNFGAVHIVVNNAGFLRDRAFHNLTPDQLDPVLDVHLRAAFFVTQPAWRQMREQTYGRIVNTSSNSGLIGNFGQSNYGAAKMGLVGFTRVLAIEGAKYGIRVNAVAPVARTRMTEELLGAEAAERLDPAHVAKMVAYLAHEECVASGEVFSAGGGRFARFFIGLTTGHFDPEATPDSIAEHIEEIRSTDRFFVPTDPREELADILDRWA